MGQPAIGLSCLSSGFLFLGFGPHGLTVHTQHDSIGLLWKHRSLRFPVSSSVLFMKLKTHLDLNCRLHLFVILLLRRNCCWLCQWSSSLEGFSFVALVGLYLFDHMIHLSGPYADQAQTHMRWGLCLVLNEKLWNTISRWFVYWLFSVENAWFFFSSRSMNDCFRHSFYSRRPSVICLEVSHHFMLSIFPLKRK